MELRFTRITLNQPAHETIDFGLNCRCGRHARMLPEPRKVENPFLRESTAQRGIRVARPPCVGYDTRMFKLMVGVLVGLFLVGAGWWYYSDGGKKDPVDGFQDAVKYQTKQTTKAVTEKIENSVNTIKEEFNDAAILASIKTKFFKEDTLDGLKIEVDVENGVVKLNGTVSSPEARALAIKLVRETDGVKKYIPTLKVVLPKD